MATLSEAHSEIDYVEFEARFRGTGEEIAKRLERYLPLVREVQDKGPVIDLGCGRGEALAMFADHGIVARGVDASERMVELCRARGLEAETGDAIAVLEATPAKSSRRGRFVSRRRAPTGPGARSPGARRVRRPRARGCRSLWRLRTRFRWSSRRATSGSIRRTCARSTPTRSSPSARAPASRRSNVGTCSRSPPTPVCPRFRSTSVAEEQRPLADRVNRLRDHLDDLLYGFQDYAIVARKG